MIISRKRFEEEVQKRVEKDSWIRGVSGDIWELKDKVRELEWKTKELQERMLLEGKMKYTVEAPCNPEIQRDSPAKEKTDG